MVINLSVTISNIGATTNNNLYCQLCDGRGHTARVCRTRSHNHLQARANYATHLQNQSAPWIVDSGAIHHIASDTQSLTTTQDYHGSEEIVIGNGNTIPISHTGNVNFNASNHQFQLQHDLTTGAPLAHEWSKNGLYEWPPGDFDGLPQCNVVVPYYMFCNKVNVSWDNISIEQQSKKESNSILHSSYELPPPVTTLPTVTQRLQAISSAPDGVSTQSAPQPLPSRPLITYHKQERPPIPSQTPCPPHNPSASTQNQPHMTSCPSQPASTLSQPDPPTQTRPNQPATKVHPMTTRSQTHSIKPCQFLTTTTLSPKIPITHKQAKLIPQWNSAMQAEFDALVRNHTWDLVPCDSSKIVVDLVKLATVRLVLTIATQLDWHVHQLDVNNAFLQGRLTEEVNMRQPPGFENSGNPTHVCRLQKAIYGLKQAPRAWYTELKNYLLTSGFVKSHSDSSLFIMHKVGLTVYILVYVDDILVTSNHQRGVHYIIEALSQRFSLKDLGPLLYFLGIEVIRSFVGLLLSLEKYTMDLLHEVAMDNCKYVSTPMTSTIVFDPSPDDHLVDGSLYRRIIGKLHYLSFTRPDIAFVVSKLSQAMHQPFMLLAYSNSDWAGDPHDRTSIAGYVIYLGSSPISWSSNKQRSVSHSSTEVEYRAVVATVSETNWLTNFLQELQFPLTAAPRVLCDNINTTYICANPVSHSRMKHVAIDFHFVREQVERKQLEVSHLHATDQVADLLTKPLPRAHFGNHFSMLGVVNLDTNLQGRNNG
ncbi:hypothetical protein KY284_010713 [Solanum tuberosum]|nr:hypothetical protein KY284_010713 [Solanum tuberosum]